MANVTTPTPPYSLNNKVVTAITPSTILPPKSVNLTNVWQRENVKIGASILTANNLTPIFRTSTSILATSQNTTNNLRPLSGQLFPRGYPIRINT